MNTTTPNPTPQGPAAKPPRRRSVVAAFIGGWFNALILGAMLLFGTQAVLASPVPGLLGVERTFRAFPERVREVGFSDAYDFLRDCPYSKTAKLEKWTTPIKVRYEGLFEDKDVAVLRTIAREFNTVKGFPGITIVASGENVLVSYITMDSYAEYKAKYEASTTDESFCSHWSTNGQITKAGIVIRVDQGDQDYRNSVVLHEFFHLVGFQSHTSQRQSILNTVGPVDTLSSTDLLAFGMVYDPAVKPNMTYDALKKALSSRSASAYITPSAPYESEDALPDLPIPAAVAGAVLLLGLPGSVKKLGGAGAAARLLAQVSGLLLVAYFYCLYFPLFADGFQMYISTGF